MRFVDNGINTKLRTDHFSPYVIHRENLIDREGQTDGTPADKYHFR